MSLHPPRSAAAQPSLDAARETLGTYLTEADWRAALDRIERQPATLEIQDHPERRVGQERTPRQLNCLIRLEQPDRPPAIHLVRTRNISCGGLAVLHGGSIPVGTPLVIALEAAAGQGLIQRATVVWSRRIDSLDPRPAAYEMGLQFDRPIFVDQFLGD